MSFFHRKWHGCGSAASQRVFNPFTISDKTLCFHLRTDLVSVRLSSTHPTFPQDHTETDRLTPTFLSQKGSSLGAYLVHICNHNSFPSTYHTWIAFAFDASNLHRDIRLHLPSWNPSLTPPFLQRSLSPPITPPRPIDSAKCK